MLVPTFPSLNSDLPETDEELSEAAHREVCVPEIQQCHETVQPHGFVTLQLQQPHGTPIRSQLAASRALSSVLSNPTFRPARKHEAVE